MILNPFKLKAETALMAEADDLEERLGPAEAVRHVREMIAQAKRDARPHLYRLHDEIARRHPTASAA
jgi:hypothetical protein